MLRLSNFIVDGIVYSNLWISAGAVCFSTVGASVLGYQLSNKFIAFIFCTTLFTYNFQRLVKLKSKNQQPISGPRAEWVQKHLILVYALTIVGSLGGIIFGYNYVKSYAGLLFLVGFFSFFYVWKLPFFKRNVRSIPTIKLFVLSGTWVLATQVLPFLVFSTNSLSFNVALFFLSSLFFMCAISIPFDIRDLVVDDKSLKTVPQIFGVKGSVAIAITMLFLSVLMALYVSENHQIGLLINGVLAGLIIYFSIKNNDELYYSGLTDGTLIFMGVLVYFL